MQQDLTQGSIRGGLIRFIMDPYLKSDYSKTDKRHLLTQIQPGLLRARVEDMDDLLLYTFYIIENPTTK